MHWDKLGLLYTPGVPGRHEKLLTHAANPLALRLTGDVYRIYYSGRDAQQRSSVGAVDVDIVQRRVVQDHSEPFLQHGPPGSFHADGVSIGNCYRAAGRTYMLFMGWQAPPGRQWRGDIGRIEVLPDFRLLLDGEAPFMGADATDPISLSYPWVRATQAGYAMWYGSTLSWDAGNGEMLHVIQRASSADGHQWRREGLAVPYQIGVAQAFSRPTVAVDPDGDHHMWFSFRAGGGDKYRIGHAASPDGARWQLALDQASLGVSAEGWDSEMVEYPFVFDHEGERYMLYNGNGFGRTGFGLAVLAR
jgi:hypothetical protein